MLRLVKRKWLFKIIKCPTLLGVGHVGYQKKLALSWQATLSFRNQWSDD